MRLWRYLTYTISYKALIVLYENAGFKSLTIIQNDRALVATVMPLFIKNIEHSHDSDSFVAGASSICSKVEVEFVVHYTMGRQQLNQDCVFVAFYFISVINPW